MEESAPKSSPFLATLRGAVMLCLLFCIPAMAMFDRPLRNFVRQILHPESSANNSDDSAVDSKSQESNSAWPGQRQGASALKNQPPGSSQAADEASNQTQSPPSDAGLLPGPHGSTPAWSESAPQATTQNQAIESPPWQTAPKESGSQESEGFDSMHRRLEQLGATYYLLETWGRGGALYRFHCKMAIGENPNFTRQFEATDSDPMVAMRRVLGEVETWHEKRRY